MKFHILTLFPSLFDSFLAESIVARAKDAGVFEVKVWNIRDFSTNRHKKVDDTPYGGGAGMVMACQPLFDCIETVKKEAPNAPVIFLTPHGERFTQRIAEKYAKEEDSLILLCGRYEGIDERVRQTLVDAEISIGDFVLTGGELPAQMVMDAVIRLLPGALGNEESHEEESFSLRLEGKKEYPHYTKPEEFRGMKVPDILLSGHHAKIEKWRREQCS